MRKLFFILLLAPFFASAQSVDGALKTLTASGTDTYAVTEPLPAAYSPKERFLVRFTNANTGAATLNRSTLGAKAIVKADGSALSAGDIEAGGTYLLSYNGTNYQMVGDGGGGGSMVYPGAGLAKSNGSAWGTSITDNSTNWNTAFGWGDHATEGYITSVGTGVANQLTYWSGVNTLGSLATATYPSLTELSYIKGLTSAAESRIANGVTAFGWGNHAGLYTPLSFKTTLDALNGILKSNGVGTFSAVTDNSSDWNTAFGWGDHAGLYKLDSYVPDWSEITSTPTTIAGYGITDFATSGDALWLQQQTATNGHGVVWDNSGTSVTDSGGVLSGDNNGDQYFENQSTGTTHVIEISGPAGSGGTTTFQEGSNITFTTTGTITDGIVTIAATGPTSIAGITGTTADFNTALTDNDFATLAGSETLTNKVISPASNTIRYPTRTQSGTSYTIQASDENYAILFTSASPVAVLLPDGLSTNFSCAVFNYGGGDITLSATTTLNSTATTIETIYTGASVQHTGSNIWLATGALGAASGSGDVVGPASAVNNNVAFFDGVTGKLIKDSGLALSGSNSGDQALANTSDATSHTVTLTGGTSVQLIEGSNITLTTGGTGGVGTVTIASTGGGGSALSGLTAATGTNNIDNLNNTQTWNWNTLTANGISFLSNTTAAVNGQNILYSKLEGANAASSVTSRTTHFENTHTGTGSINIAQTLNASGGSTNVALEIQGGRIDFNDGVDITLGSTTGTKIGTATSSKLGFYNATPVVRQSAVTTPQGIADALTAYGLLPSSTIGSGGTTTLNFAVGEGTAITTGGKARTRVIAPVSGTITGWSLIADQSCTATVDIWKDTVIPDNADTITASAKPGITAAEFNSSTTLTGWTTTVTAGDILMIEVETNNNALHLNLQLKIAL